MRPFNSGFKLGSFVLLASLATFACDSDSTGSDAPSDADDTGGSNSDGDGDSGGSNGDGDGDGDSGGSGGDGDGDLGGSSGDGDGDSGGFSGDGDGDSGGSSGDGDGDSGGSEAGGAPGAGGDATSGGAPAAGGSQNATSLKIVVMGSSSAAGKNLYKDDPNANCGFPGDACKEAYRVDRWSNQYENDLDGSMDATVVNIANPGMPVEDALPGGVAGFGIDEALAESPDAIIMAFPIGNDLSRNVPNCNQATTPERVSCALTIYAENLIQLIRAADDAGVPVWVTTTQPQVAWLTPTDPLPPDLDMLAASKESMTMLAGGFAGIAGADAVTFGTIDFWTPLQAPPPNPEENADPNLIVTLGVDDNGHPNIAGHTKLTEAVIAADIPGNL